MLYNKTDAPSGIIMNTVAGNMYLTIITIIQITRKKPPNVKQPFIKMYNLANYLLFYF